MQYQKTKKVVWCRDKIVGKICSKLDVFYCQWSRPPFRRKTSHFKITSAVPPVRSYTIIPKWEVLSMFHLWNISLLLSNDHIALHLGGQGKWCKTIEIEWNAHRFDFSNVWTKELHQRREPSHANKILMLALEGWSLCLWWNYSESGTTSHLCNYKANIVLMCWFHFPVVQSISFEPFPFSQRICPQHSDES